VFSFCLAIASQIAGETGTVGVPVFLELGGAVVLGVTIGLPAAFLTGRIEEGEPLQVEALAIGFLTAGLAVWFGVSFLLAGMVVGALIVNLAAHHTRAFHEIEHVQWPFMIVFFILAGASLELETLMELGIIGGALIALRAVSRLLGGWLGATLSSVPIAERSLYGIALLPQAGVAIGMALMAGAGFAHVGGTDYWPYHRCHRVFRTYWPDCDALGRTSQRLGGLRTALAQGRIRHCLQTCIRDWFFAFCANPVRAILDPFQGQLEQRNFLLCRSTKAFEHLVILDINGLFIQVSRLGFTQLVIHLVDAHVQFQKAVGDQFFKVVQI
jgi:Kef-type K+ transport system membrane component KefB